MDVPGGGEQWQHGEVCVSKSVLLPGAEFNLWSLSRICACSIINMFNLLVCGGAAIEAFFFQVDQSSSHLKALLSFL